MVFTVLREWGKAKWAPLPLHLLLIAFLFVVPFTAVNADDGGKTGQMIHLSVPTGDGQADVNWTVAEFEKLAPLTTITTSTPWMPKASFSGIAGRDLAEKLGLQKGTVRLRAINEYVIDMPVSDLRDTGMIFATRKNDAPLTLAEKGPVLVVFPYDRDPDRFTSPDYVARSVWFLSDITVLPDAVVKEGSTLISEMSNGPPPSDDTQH